ncbi:MAG: hypothetical protein EXS38_03775 [Opitutus sp.]|nr:hypothetical protein [Opitutus sp.]
MKTSTFKRTLQAGGLVALLGGIAPIFSATAVPVAAPEMVLFPFDDQSLPFSKGLVLSLVAGRKSATSDPAHPNKPVLAIGNPGDPDHPRVYFYGTVLPIDGGYRMWYTGYDKKGERQVCYAVSKDGLVWEKPKLGLVDYNGSKENNLVAFNGAEPLKGLCALVIHEPEDPNPARRFKMLREIAVPGLSWRIFAAVSPDGIRWQPVGDGKQINSTQIEPSGFIKFNGVYYLNGHSAAIRHPVPGAHKRTMQTFASYDFATWTQAAHMSFRRDNLPPRPPSDFEGNRGEQVHVGASLWNRGNVVLGFYGQYHNPTNDRRTSYCDLGLIVSHDALHFSEPIPDFKIIPSLEEPDRAEPRLTQGEGFLNVGDRTLVYYGIWTEVNRDGPTGVRVATWPRDRLGFYKPAPGVENAHCVSRPLFKPGARLFVNVDGLSEETHLTVEILDEQFRPIPGYSGEDCVALDKSGLRQPVTWRGKNTLANGDRPVRVRVNWVGVAPDAAKLYAIYLE